MCKFNRSWIGICKNDNAEGEEYCNEHLNIKCSVCGEQATHDCPIASQLVCGTPLCDSLECKLQHYYLNHTSSVSLYEIKNMEEKLNIKPFDIVFSKINFGDKGEVAKLFNEHYKDQYQFLLVTYNKNNKVKLHRVDIYYEIKNKNGIGLLFENYPWCKKSITGKNIYFFNEEINISIKYPEDIVNNFEKVI